MREPNTFFQDISIRRRVVIAIGICTVLIVVTGLYGLIAVAETNRRLHKSVLEGQAMIEATDTARLAQVHFKKQVQEWKDILLRGNEQGQYDRHRRAFDTEDQLVNKYLQSLSEMSVRVGFSAREIAEAIKVHRRLGDQYREALKGYRPSDLRSGVLVDRKVRGIDREPTDQIDAIVSIIKTEADKRLKATENIAKTQMEAYQSFSYILIFLVVAGLGFGIFNVRSITRDLPPEGNENGPESEEL